MTEGKGGGVSCIGGSGKGGLGCVIFFVCCWVFPAGTFFLERRSVVSFLFYSLSLLFYY